MRCLRLGEFEHNPPSHVTSVTGYTMQRRHSNKNHILTTDFYIDTAAVLRPCPAPSGQIKAQPPTHSILSYPTFTKTRNHSPETRTTECHTASTSSSTLNRSHNHHHPLHHPDDHPPNPDTISTSDSNPSPHEPAAQATETAAQLTHPQSCRSS